jgi:molybdopterin-containing oxidoreductase family membrane subunit
VITVLALLRWLFKWENYIRDDHFDALARLLIVVAVGWFYFFVIEFMMGFYPNEEPELSLRNLQLTVWPFNAAFIVFALMAFFVPVPLWMFRKVRRNVALMFWTTVMVNIGMWLERFLIIVPSLMRKQVLTFNWGSYNPSPIELILVGGSFAMVFLGVLTFVKFFPIIPLADAKEGQIMATEIRVGKVMVPAAYREE